MPIYDQGYRRWKGEIVQRPLRWWPILRRGVLPPLKRRRNILLLVLAWVPIFVRAVTLYLDLKAGSLLRGGGGALLDTGLPFFYGVIRNQGFFVLLFVVMVGSDLIAKDRRFNALQIYFSKPLTPTDYILGKLGIVAVFLLLVTWVPTLLLWLFAIAVSTAEGYFSAVWSVPLAATAYCVTWTLVAGLLILALSAIGQRGVYIAGGWLILYGFGPLQVFTKLLKTLTGSEYFGLLSLEGVVRDVGAWFFGQEGPNEFHPLISFVLVVGVVALCWWILRRRIRPVEVVL